MTLRSRIASVLVGFIIGFALAMVVGITTSPAYAQENRCIIAPHAAAALVGSRIVNPESTIRVWRDDDVTRAVGFVFMLSGGHVPPALFELDEVRAFQEGGQADVAGYAGGCLKVFMKDIPLEVVEDFLDKALGPRL